MFKKRFEEKLNKIQDWSVIISKDESLNKLNQIILDIQSDKGLGTNIDKLLRLAESITVQKYHLETGLAEAEQDLRVAESVYDELKAQLICSQQTEKITEARNRAKVQIAKFDDKLIEARLKRDIYKNAVNTSKGLVDIIRSEVSYYKQELHDKNYSDAIINKNN